MEKTCLVCFDHLSPENSAEYQTCSKSQWFPAAFCLNCIEILQQSQFKKYCYDLASTTCAKQQRILLERGPPINVHDSQGFPETLGAEVFRLRRAANRMEFSAKLAGALEGHQRLQFWDHQKKFIIQNETIEEDAAMGTPRKGSEVSFEACIGNTHKASDASAPLLSSAARAFLADSVSPYKRLLYI